MPKFDTIADPLWSSQLQQTLLWIPPAFAVIEFYLMCFLVVYYGYSYCFTWQCKLQLSHLFMEHDLYASISLHTGYCSYTVSSVLAVTKQYWWGSCWVKFAPFAQLESEPLHLQDLRSCEEACKEWCQGQPTAWGKSSRVWSKQV